MLEEMNADFWQQNISEQISINYFQKASGAKQNCLVADHDTENLELIRYISHQEM